MALTVHQSNRLEDLSALLCAFTQQPLSRILAAEEMIVGASGMRRYLNKIIAREHGVAAHIRYSKMTSFFWRITQICLPETPKSHVYSPDVLRWYLLDLLHSKTWESPELAEVRTAWQPYLDGHDTAAYQLCGKMAELFDQYLVYRPQWIAAWDKNHTANLGEHELWQMRLWQYLRQNINTPHRVGLWQDLKRHLEQDRLPEIDRLPERIFVFGFSAIAPMYLALLDALAKHIDVHLLLLNPAQHYWGDVSTRPQASAEGEATPHSLLASLGQQGRHFFSSILELNPLLENSLFTEEPTSDSLLHRLQFAIQSMSLPPKPNDSQADHSIVLHSAHSPLRELQAAKEAILAFLQDNPQAKPEDIAILSPNIDVYVPFIDAVFGNPQDALPALPYSIADTKITHHNPFLSAWENLLQLFDSRFESDWVLALLDNHCVAERFALSTEDVALCRHWVKILHIHWGMDSDMRAQYSKTDTAPDAAFTWQQGIQRLLGGILLPESDSLWQGIAPLNTPLDTADTATAFAAFLYALFDAYTLWHSNATLTEWFERIEQISDALLQGENFRPHFQQQIDTWQAQSAVVHTQTLFSPTIIATHLHTLLTQPGDQGFLRGGITFCSMMPMRSLPFAYLALLGMNDGAFPRISRHLPFDLMASFPKAGDRARRDDDRYLFLEILLSARQVLHISFVGRHIQDNSPLEPSGLVHELADACATMNGISPADFWQQHRTDHPLHAFSKRYFLSSGSLKSFRQDYAQAYQQDKTIPADFLADWQNSAPAPSNHIELADWLQFWQNPIRHWLRHSLLWQDVYFDEDVQYTEPFSAEDEETIYAALILARQEGRDFDQLNRQLQAENRYPAGQLGKQWQKQITAKIQGLDSALFQAKPAPTPIHIHINEVHFSGSLTPPTNGKQIFFHAKKPNFVQRLRDYWLHLFACAALADESISTHIVWPEDNELLCPIPHQEALILLEKTIFYYQQGQREPLPFFARTAFLTTEKWLKDGEEAALNTAQESFFHSSEQRKAQIDYREVRTLYAHSKKSPIEMPLFKQLIEEIMLPIMTICLSGSPLPEDKA